MRDRLHPSELPFFSAKQGIFLFLGLFHQSRACDRRKTSARHTTTFGSRIFLLCLRSSNFYMSNTGQALGDNPKFLICLQVTGWAYWNPPPEKTGCLY